jgi:transposase-like protein
MNGRDYSKRQARRYDADYKRHALALISNGKTMIAVSRELGVCKSTLKYWQRQPCTTRRHVKSSPALHKAAPVTAVAVSGNCCWRKVNGMARPGLASLT